MQYLCAFHLKQSEGHIFCTRGQLLKAFLIKMTKENIYFTANFEFYDLTGKRLGDIINLGCGTVLQTNNNNKRRTKL